MKRLTTILLVMLMVFTLVSCAAPATPDASESSQDSQEASVEAAELETAESEASEPSADGDGETKKLIALSQGESGNAWRTTNTNDVEKWITEAGYDFIWTDGKNDASTQLSQIEDLITLKPDLLIIAPLQADALSPAIDMVNEAQIPMITIDRELNADPGEGSYLAKIVQDWVESGRKTARRAVEILTEKNGSPKGKILEITGTIGSSPTVDKGNGIREILDEYPDIEIVETQSGNYDRAAGRAVMDDFLNKYPEGSIDLLICYSDDDCLGALQAMNDAGRTDLLGLILSQDGLKDAIKEVIDGNVDTTYQCPPYYGEVTVELINKILNGEEYDSVIDVPFKTFNMYELKDITEDYYQYLVDNELDY